MGQGEPNRVPLSQLRRTEWGAQPQGRAGGEGAGRRQGRWLNLRRPGRAPRTALGCLDLSACPDGSGTQKLIRNDTLRTLCDPGGCRRAAELLVAEGRGEGKTRSFLLALSPEKRFPQGPWRRVPPGHGPRSQSRPPPAGLPRCAPGTGWGEAPGGPQARVRRTQTRAPQSRTRDSRAHVRGGPRGLGPPA